MITTLRRIDSPKDWIVYDGQDLRDFKVYCSGDQTFSSPQRMYDTITIPGRNGDYKRDLKRYGAMDVTYSCWIGSDFRNNIAALKSFLLSRSDIYCRLEDTYNPERYRLASYEGPLSVKGYYGSTFGQFDLTFKCRPEFWYRDGDIEYPISEAYLLGRGMNNPSPFPSKPLVMVKIGATGNNVTSVVINGVTIELGNGIYGWEYYIDSESKQVWYYDNGGTGPKVWSNQVVTRITDRDNWFTLKPKGESNTIYYNNVYNTQGFIKPRWYDL